jgi:enoyl-CoA hydratase/carnithine racemase
VTDANAYTTIRLDRADAVARVTLNQPGRKNAIGPTTVNELIHALDAVRDDQEVRVVILAGEGSSFSAGGDLSQMDGEGDSSVPPQGDYVDLLLRLLNMEKPIVARVQGHALGGGLGLVASCHFAIAAESARLGTPEVRHGLFPMMIMAVLARITPQRKLLQMMMLGEILRAHDALDAGLVSHVVPDEDLDERVGKIASKLGSQSPTAMRLGLRAFRHQADKSLEEALPYLRDQLFAMLATEDAQEGIAAFLQKRDPKWTGR